MAAGGFESVAWYGIRVMSDHLLDAPGAELADLLPVEIEAARRDPYVHSDARSIWLHPCARREHRADGFRATKPGLRAGADGSTRDLMGSIMTPAS